MFGYTSIHFISSDIDATSGEPSDDNGRIMILPFIKRSQAYEIIRSLVPEMQFNTAHAGMPMRISPSFSYTDYNPSYSWNSWMVFLVSMVIRHYGSTNYFICHCAILYVCFGGYNLENDELVIQKHHYSILKDITLNLIK